MGDIACPVSLKDISKVEKLNEGLSVNVFGFQDHVIPLRISTVESPERVVDLMLYQGHYSCVQNLDRLLYDQRGYKVKKYFCRRCLLPQYSETKLFEHQQRCSNQETVRTVFPEDQTLKFKNFNRAHRSPYVMYADFESILKPIEGCQPSSSSSYTQKYQHHEACGYGLIDVFDCCGENPKLGDPKIYRGEDTVEKFLETVVQMAEKHQERLNFAKPLEMGPEDWIKYNSQTNCHI